jgi:hypothetical protein
MQLRINYQPDQSDDVYGGASSDCNDERCRLEYDGGLFGIRHANDDDRFGDLHLGGSGDRVLGITNGMQLWINHHSGQPDDVHGGIRSDCNDERFCLEHDGGLFGIRHANDDDRFGDLYLGGSRDRVLGITNSMQLWINHHSGQSGDVYGGIRSQCRDGWFGLGHDGGLLVRWISGDYLNQSIELHLGGSCERSVGAKNGLRI